MSRCRSRPQTRAFGHAHRKQGGGAARHPKERVPLTPRATVPPSIQRIRNIIAIRTATLDVLAHPLHAQNSRHEPADGRQERKRRVRLPRCTAVAAEAQMAPVKDVAAAAVAEKVDEQAKDDEPGDGEDEVGRPVDKGAGKGQQPEERQEEREAGGDFDVDEAAEGRGGAVALEVEVVACYAGYDGGEDELGQRDGLVKRRLSEGH